MAEKIWQIFHGRNQHTQLCCSSQKRTFLTNGAPFERELYRLSSGIRSIAKKPCDDREIINQTQISLLFVLSLSIYHLLRQMHVNPPASFCSRENESEKKNPIGLRENSL
jgi:hypothetical protein